MNTLNRLNNEPLKLEVLSWADAVKSRRIENASRVHPKGCDTTIFIDGELVCTMRADAQWIEDLAEVNLNPINIAAGMDSVPVQVKAGGHWRSHYVGIDSKTGEPYTFGAAVALTAGYKAPQWTRMFLMGDTLTLNGKLYTIERAPNDNIKLTPKS